MPIEKESCSCFFRQIVNKLENFYSEIDRLGEGGGLHEENYFSYITYFLSVFCLQLLKV